MIPGTVSKLSVKRKPAASTIVADADVIVLTGSGNIDTMIAKTGGMSNTGQLVWLLPAAGTGTGITITTNGNMLNGGLLDENIAIPWIFSPLSNKWHRFL